MRTSKMEAMTGFYTVYCRDPREDLSGYVIYRVPLMVDHMHLRNQVCPSVFPSTLWFWHDNFCGASEAERHLGSLCPSLGTFLGLKVKVKPKLCQHFGSDTITWVVFNVQPSYFIHRWRMMWSWGPKVKVTPKLCQNFGSDTITWVVFNVQLSYFIHRWRMVRGRYQCILGSKCQGHT